MGFFDRFKKDKGIELTAPMKGKCVSIKEVPDPTFAEEILGKGIAVIPQDGHVYAPADGKISTVFPTGHAVGITTADGAEILIHIGLDTVELKGEPFEQKVKEGQDVKKGDLLVVGKFTFMKSRNMSWSRSRLLMQRQRLPGSKQLRRLPSDSWMTYMKKRLQKQAKNRR